MKLLKLEEMKGGWFVGDFTPTIVPTGEVEVAVKSYAAGASEARHYHKVAREITVIVSGKVRMNGVECGSGDIVVVEPGEATDFQALEDTVTTVVKMPSAKDDKYLAEES